MNGTTATGEFGQSNEKPAVRVSVVIPTRNRPNKMLETVKSILDGSRIPQEIVVSDQSADIATRSFLDRIRENVNGCEIRYVRSSRPGASSNRNTGYRASAGSFIAFVDDDVRVDRRWLENMLREWEEHWDRGPVLISGRIFSGAEEGSMPDLGVRLSCERSVAQNPPRRKDILFGGAFAANRELLDRLGPLPFDERLGPGSPFRGGEDEDLGYRALLAGFPVVYEPTITVTHYPEMMRPLVTAFSRSFGGGAFFAKHVLNGDWALLPNFGRVLFVQLAKSFRSCLRLRADEGAMRLFAFAGLLAGFLGWAVSARSSPEIHDEADAGSQAREADRQ